PGWAQDVTGKDQLTIKPVGRELVPSEDQNRFIVNLICPVGSSVDYVDDRLKEGEDILIGLRDPVTQHHLAAGVVASIAIRPGTLVSEGMLFVRLVPTEKRSWTQTDVINAVRQAFNKGLKNVGTGEMLGPVAGVRAVVLDLSTQGFTATRGYPIDFAVQGP